MLIFLSNDEHRLSATHSPSYFNHIKYLLNLPEERITESIILNLSVYLPKNDKILHQYT